MSVRILIVEDDAGIRAMLERGLRLAGHETVMSEDIATARALWGDRFDLVLLDVMLPDGNGLELLAERRAAGDETPTVLLTAREEPHLRERAAGVGANAYLPKPFAYDELLSVVARWTSGNRP